jgi:hypothetical protein
MKAAQGNTHKRNLNCAMKSEWIKDSAEADARVKVYEKNNIPAEKVECGEKRKGYYIMIRSKDFVRAHKKGIAA